MESIIDGVELCDSINGYFDLLVLNEYTGLV